ncbi:hypothetical protein Q8W71_00245 [Methylobacterium sp. NEAU 140]|uniref:hypothetical protein n=1 Tax=Methylobacterium sp. NEAU 140 TaxID=3064945 RepID=UPI00273293E4|nr:hypothetical protein [Methylobacterium sp. NEAU 140]MDP4021039.1 hypothetical protein [Methylobacterium sp. NEAU 140]
MPIKLDITGFYYSIDVDSSGVTTVLDVLNRANGIRSPNGGVLSFRLDKGFVSSLTVEYDGQSSPKSRQNNSPFGPNRPVGIYSYTDDVFSQSNRISNSGNIPGLLAWQYYIFDSAGKQKSGDRTIVPVSKASTTFQIQDGDRIVWRLIGIFGLNQFIDAAQQNLVAEAKGQPLSLKAAGDILDKNGGLIPV